MGRSGDPYVVVGALAQWRRIAQGAPHMRDWFVEADDETPLTRLYLGVRRGGVKL